MRLEALVEAAAREFGGDRSRVYLTGQSYGGKGVWDYGAQRPSAFAALVPVCPAAQPTTLVTPKEYVKHPTGQPEIADAARCGRATTYRPALRQADVVVLDNRLVWHRTPESLTLADDADVAPDDALMTIRLKYFPPREAKPAKGGV